MRIHLAWMGSVAAMALTAPLIAQVPVLSNIQAPYPALQSPAAVHVSGGSYPSGVVSYGPPGTPLVLSGMDLGPKGTVLFPGATKGSSVAAVVTNWTPTILFLTVPATATTGLVQVNTEGKTSNGLPFIVTKGVYAGSCPAMAPNSQLEITTSSLPNGTVSKSYSAVLNASGGKPPYTWSLSIGSLPAGLSLQASNGSITGTPTTSVTSASITVQARDSAGQANDATLTVSVDSPSMVSATVYSYAVPLSGGFDGTGNILQMSDSVMGNWSYGYDNLNRLTSAASTGGDYSGQSQCMAYDSFGNRTQSNLQTSACSSGEAATASYSGANRVAWTTVNGASNGFSYDASGNVVYDNANSYAYDGEGRLCAVQSNPITGGTVAYGYLYDAEGRRVAKGTITPNASQPCNPATNGFTLTESYVLGQSGEQLTVLDRNNNWQRTNVYGAGTLLATYDTVGLHFHLTDPLGTRRVQTNAQGQPELDCQSLAYGDQQYCFPDANAPASAEDATPLHFTGKERDTESGLDYFGARYMSSNMGRFLSPDFQDMSDEDTPEAIPNGDVSNPQTLNLYSYTQNNPLSRRDYDGHASWQDCGDGSGSQCWTGDYNGEQNNGAFWNSQSKQWQGSDPNPPPSDDPAGIFFTGLTRSLLGQPYGLKQMAVGMGTAFVRGGGNPVGMALASAIPVFIPKGWIEKPSNRGTGTKYVDPSNPHNSVRLEPAKPGSSNPGQQRDYMVVTKNGKTLDANGNPVPRQSLESHIPQGTELPADTFGPVP